MLAHDLAYAMGEIDIMIMAEPNKALMQKAGWITDK